MAIAYQNMTDDAGRIAYEAYWNMYKPDSTVPEYPMPKWEDQTDYIKAAWAAATVAVAEELCKQLGIEFHNYNKKLNV